MIYIAIDTDVWLHLATYGFDKEHNPFNELRYWMELGEVTCIVSGQIINEWHRNKESKVNGIKLTMTTSVGQLRTAVQDRKIFSDVFNANNFEAISRMRIGLIEEVFQNQALVAPVTDSVKLAAGDRTLQRLAPCHKKDSYSDAVNILAVLDYVRQAAITPVMFTSKNFHDYSAVGEPKRLHADLQPLFNEVDLTYAPDVDDLFRRLREQLPSFNEYLKRQREEETVGRKLAAQQEKQQLANTDQDYINNVAMIEQVLQQPRPTQFQCKMILDLINSDEHCRKYFFDHVAKPAWLAFMEELGFLEPSNHPGPVQSPEGTYLSRWESLGFLERLSEHVKNNPDDELTASIIGHVHVISEAGIDNDLTSTLIIRVLSNLPNEAISEDLLDHVPGWFSKTGNKMFPSSAICERLLPNFINEHATAPDLAKGEKILRYLLGISKDGVEIDNTAEKSETSFYPNCYPWVLADALIKKDLIAVIARRCSLSLFYEFARTVKKLIIDYPNGLHLRLNGTAENYVIKIMVDLPDLNIEMLHNGEAFSQGTLKDFELIDKDGLKASLLHFLSAHNVPFESTPENEQAVTGLVIALTTDKLSMAGATPIADMNIDRAHSKHFRSVFAIVLAQYLSAVTDGRPTDAHALQTTLFYDAQYRLPLFRRIVLYNLSLHFETQRSLFTYIIAQDNPEHIFDNYILRPDLFKLLQDCQLLLNEEEKKSLSNIIQAGPPESKQADERAIAYWQFRWYLALNQTEPFASQYESVREQFDLHDRDVDPTQTIRFRSGSVSPVSVEELLSMDDELLVGYVASFQVDDRWEGPNIEGLSDTLKHAVSREPERFISLLKDLLNWPYVYVYHLLYALLDESRKKKEDMDWVTVIAFCRAYVSRPDFMAQNRRLPGDARHADEHWVMGVIVYLISEVCRLDEAVKNTGILQDCEATLLLMKQYSIIAAQEVPQHGDYITHSYNSDNGKFLRACMDYCLCSNRINHKERPEFYQPFKAIFDTYLSKDSIDALTIIGYYWQQFNYLDHSWLLNRLRLMGDLQEFGWDAFMGGFLFSPAPGTDELLEIVTPFYARAIEKQYAPKVGMTDGLALHMATLFLWGLIDLSESSLLTGYISSMPVEGVRDLLHVIFFSHEYFKSLGDQEQLAAESKIIGLIEFLHHHYGESNDAAVIELRRSTVNMIYMLRALNKENAAVIITAIGLGSKQFHHDDLFKPLHQLMVVATDLIDTARHLATILNEMTFQEHLYLLEADKKYLSDIVEYLYAHGEKETANKVCNRLMIAGQHFAGDLFRKHNQ